jgi:hypothetical protein
MSFTFWIYRSWKNNAGFHHLLQPIVEFSVAQHTSHLPIGVFYMFAGLPLGLATVQNCPKIKKHFHISFTFPITVANENFNLAGALRTS